MNLYENIKKNLNETEILTEKVNHDNDDINEKIRKALRSKQYAKQYAKDFEDVGITIDDSPREGITLIGPTGNKLSADRTYIYGPTRPGHNKTHYRGNGAKYDKDSSSWKDWTAKDEKAELDDYQDAIDSRRELADKYSKLSDDEIQKRFPRNTHENAIKRNDKEIDELINGAVGSKYWGREKNNFQKRLSSNKATRREGHANEYRSDRDIRRKTNRKQFNNIDKIDYKGYLDSNIDDKRKEELYVDNLKKSYGKDWKDFYHEDR